MPELRLAVYNFVARPIQFIVLAIYKLCINLELDAVKMDLDLATFRSTWKQLQDYFSQADQRSLDQIADDVKCAALWKKLVQRNRQRADDMYILERFSQLHHDGRRRHPWIYHPQEAVSLLAAQRRINNEKSSLKSILDIAVEAWYV